MNEVNVQAMPLAVISGGVGEIGATPGTIKADQTTWTADRTDIRADQE
jgi:hypothetical protein